MNGTSAVLFDLDGTLTDRAATVRKYAELFMRDFGGRFRFKDFRFVASEIARIDRHGYNHERAFDLAGHSGWLSSPGAESIEDHWDMHFPACTVARDGLLPTLRALRERGLGLGLVSNGSASRQRRKITLLELESLLDAVLISEELEMAKPDPAIFEAAARALAVAPERCVFVGDHPDKDVRGAEAVGMRAVWLPGGVPWPDAAPAPARRIAGLPELLDLDLLTR